MILNWVISFLTLLALTLPGRLAQAWDLNDVTYIYSLPTSVSAGIRLSEVLPREAYHAAIGPLGLTPGAFTPGLVLTPEELYRNLSLIAFRVDPCFRDLFTDPCRMQIRAVWQPITGVNGKWTTVDAAVHTFYDLREEEFKVFLRKLLVLKAGSQKRTEGLPLGVHPELQEKTPFALGLGALLRKTISSRNMSRIALMKLFMGENAWRFSSFDVVNGKLKLMEIFPGLIREQQLANVSEEGGYDARSSLSPSVEREKPDQLFRILNGSHGSTLVAALTADLNMDQLKLYFSRSIRVGQPRLHLPGTVDCLSCHASDGVKAVTARALIARGFPVKIPQSAQRYNFRNRSAQYGSTRSQRALGYFGAGLQILDRTINESAAVADRLNQAPANWLRTRP